MEIDPVVLILGTAVVVLATILLSILFFNIVKAAPKPQILETPPAINTTSVAAKNPKNKKTKKVNNENEVIQVPVTAAAPVPAPAPAPVVVATTTTATTAVAATKETKKDNKKTEVAPAPVAAPPVQTPAPAPAPVAAPAPAPQPESTSAESDDAKKKKSKETSDQKKARKEREKEKAALKKIEDDSYAAAAHVHDPDEIGVNTSTEITRGRTSSDGWAVVPSKKPKKAITAAVSAPVASHAPIAASKTSATTEIAPVDDVIELLKDTFSVPGSKIGAIIGPKGSNINGLRDVTGVDIAIPKERDTVDVIVELTGSFEGIAKVKKAFTDLINKGFSSLLGGPDFKEGGVMVHPSYIKEILGVKGTTIRAIQDHFKVKIVVPVDVKDKKECRLTVAGSKDGVQGAKDIIKDLMKYYHTPITHPGLVHVEMDVPSHLYNHIIGARGSEIKHIQANFKVQVYIPNADSISKSVVIVGKQQAVDSAQRYIQTKIVDQAGRDDQAAVEMQLAWAQEETATHEPWMDEYTIPAAKVTAATQQPKIPIDGSNTVATGAWGTPALTSAEGW